MSTSLRNNAALLAALAALVLLGGGLFLAFYWVPNAPIEGFRQRIFYIHVPVALTAYACFGWAAWKALRLLRTGDQRHDLESYTAVHQGVIFGVLTLVTGSIWAKASWGHWFEWNEPVLVSFLIVFLLYCCYQPLRFSIDDPERQARYSSVFAIVAGGFVPLNFAAVRLAESYTHPRVLSQTGGSLPGDMRLTFLVSLLAMTLLFVTLWKLELTSKNADAQLKRLRRRLEARAPAAVA